MERSARMTLRPSFSARFFDRHHDMMAERAARSHVNAAHFGHDLFHFPIHHRRIAVFDQGVIFRHRHAGERGLPNRILPHGDRRNFEHGRLLGFAVAAGIFTIRPVGHSLARESSRLR